MNGKKERGERERRKECTKVGIGKRETGRYYSLRQGEGEMEEGKEEGRRKQKGRRRKRRSDKGQKENQ